MNRQEAELKMNENKNLIGQVLVQKGFGKHKTVESLSVEQNDDGEYYVQCTVKDDYGIYIDNLEYVLRKYDHLQPVMACNSKRHPRASL